MSTIHGELLKNLKIIMKKYKPRDHGENRMNHEGDVLLARNNFYSNNNKNLHFLLKKRFSWMNNFIYKGDVGIEVGCGTGISKEFILNANYKITDFSNYEYLDHKMIDALDTKFDNEAFDFIVSSNMIHHVPYPMRFFKEMNRILKPGGRLIIQEINCSFFMKYLLRIMRHEGFDFTVNVFDQNLICTDPNDLWSANCAIPNLLFDDQKRFHSEISNFKIIKYSHSEFFSFVNSGGVISKTFYIPLPVVFLKMLTKIDNILSHYFPNIFSLQRQIVLKKI